MPRIRKWTVIQMVLILSVTCIAALVFRTNAEANYAEASRLLAAGDYQQAEQSFSKCTIYLDSAERADQIRQYLQAMGLFNEGHLDAARELFSNLGDFEQSLQYLSKIDASIKATETAQRYNEACKYMLQENYQEAYALFKELGDYEDSASRARDCEEKWRRNSATVFSAGTRSSVGITSNNTVQFTTEDDFYGKAAISGWNDIVSVSVCGEVVIGLKRDGTVVTAKKLTDEKYDSHIDTNSWTNIIAVSAGEQHVVGLRIDGTVKAVSLLWPDGYGETAVDDWQNIIAIDATWQLTAGLDQAGNVHVAGYHAEELQRAIENSKTAEDMNARWTDVVAISVGGSGDSFYGKGHVVGLTGDGRVVAVGDNDFGQCNVDGWENEHVVAISAGDYHTVALTADGRVLTTQRKDCHFNNVDFSDSVDQIAAWEDIVAVSAGYGFTLGQKSDGSMVSAGNKNNGQADVEDWHIAIESLINE